MSSGHNLPPPRQYIHVSQYLCTVLREESSLTGGNISAHALVVIRKKQKHQYIIHVAYNLGLVVYEPLARRCQARLVFSAAGYQRWSPSHH